MIEIEIPGVPLVWKAPYVSTRGAYSIRTPIKNQLIDHLTTIYNPKPMIGYVAVDFVFLMPIPKSFTKKQRLEVKIGKLRPTKGDKTNITKFKEDILQNLFIGNDSHVIDGRQAKHYDDNPRTIVRIYPLDEYERLFGCLYLNDE